MNSTFRVFSTVLDPAEDPPGSVDPLGTLGCAERLADVLLPGLTGRMWRARLLTFAAVAAEVTERAVRKLGSESEGRIDVRLALERIFVAALTSPGPKGDEHSKEARRRLPGNSLARKAWAARQPLTRSNFLKGPAVNGPFGVMARLARDLGVTDDEGLPGTRAEELILAWAQGEKLDGILDDEHGRDRPGAVWMANVVSAVSDVLAKRAWPGPGHKIWRGLADHLSLGGMHALERKELIRLLDSEPVRRRCLELLRGALPAYRGTREEAERAVLWGQVRSEADCDDPIDRKISAVTEAVETYEIAAGLLQEGFDAMRWGLVRSGGQGTSAQIVGGSRVAEAMVELCARMSGTASKLDAALARLRKDPELADIRYTEPLEKLRDEIQGEHTPEGFADVILARHERVQKDKGKGTWIERSPRDRLLLMPGFGLDGDEPPRYRDLYIHPFRLGNAYSIMADLGQVRFEEPGDEE